MGCELSPKVEKALSKMVSLTLSWLGKLDKEEDIGYE